MKADKWDPWHVLWNFKSVYNDHTLGEKLDVDVWDMHYYEYPRDLINHWRAIYNAPWRLYHNWRHVEDMLALASRHYRGPRKHRAALVLAIMAHDLIIDGDDNEAASCLELRKKMRVYAAAAEHVGYSRLLRKINKSVDEACRLIMLTKTHTTEPNDSVGWFMILLDLHILTAPSDKYQIYRKGVMREYEHMGVSSQQFHIGRSHWIETMMGKVDSLPELIPGDKQRIVDNLFAELSSM